jgi:hypothetical protein
LNSRDPHIAPKTELVAKANRASLEAVVARQQWSKTEVAYSLHVNSSSHTTAGLQVSDFLGYLGFQRSERCSFTAFRRCYVKWVPEGFDPEAFLSGFEYAFAHLQLAERALEACGFLLPQPEGWGFYYDKPSGRPHRGPATLSGDGHSARQVRELKQTEDETFLFRFTFVETEREKGFVTHYRPKHPPVSLELRGVFHYLGLREFDGCPEFEFEPCFYRAIRFESRGNGFFDNLLFRREGVWT